MKIFKYALLVLAGLVLLAAAGIALIAANFDADRFKADAVRLVKERTQRTLVVDGAVKLSFFPRIGVQLGRLSLSDANGSKVFAAVSSARVSVEVLPLLSRQIVVDRIAIDGLRANLARHKDGSSNFDDLLGTASPGARTGAAPPPGLEIAGVDISDANLEWRDEASNRHYSIKDLSFKSGKLGGGTPEKFELALQLAATQPALDVRIGASGRMSANPRTGRFRLLDLAAAAAGSAAGISSGKLELHGGIEAAPDATALDALTVKFSGKRADQDVDAGLTIAKARIAGETLNAEKISLLFKLIRPDGDLSATLAVPAIETSGSAFKSGRLTLELEGKQGATNFKGSLASPMNGNVREGRYQLPSLVGTVSLNGPSLPKGALAISLGGNAALDLVKNTAGLALAAKFDQSTIEAKLNLNHFSPPALAFDLNIDRLNLDKYLPPRAAPPQQQQQQQKNDADQAVGLTALNALNATGKIKIGALQVVQIKVSDANAQVRLVNGKLEMSPHSARLYDGRIAGALAVDAGAHRFALKETLTAVSIGPLLNDLADKDMLEGRGNISLDLSSAGGSVRALKRALNGTARIDLRDGAIKGINLAEALRKAKSVLGARGATEQRASAQEKTDFSELGASFVVRNGVAHNDDLSLKSPFLRLSGSGDIDLGSESIDYLARAAVVASAAGQGGKNLAELKGLTIPVRLSGPFDALKYRIDFAAMAGEVAKEKAKDALKNAIGEKLGTGAAGPGGDKAKPKDQARELLKGLFGR